MTPDELSRPHLYLIRAYWVRRQGRWAPLKWALPTLLPGVVVFWVCIAMAMREPRQHPNPRSVMIFVLGLGVLIASLIATIKASQQKFERWLAPISRDDLPRLFEEISKFTSERSAKRRKQ